MKVIIPQHYHKLYDIEFNLNLIQSDLANSNLIGDVKQADEVLFVYPELFLTGYNLQNRLYEFALDIASPAIMKLKDAAIAHSVNLILGIPLNDSTIKGNVFNSAVCITRTGQITVYNKIQPANFGPFEEKLYFSEGTTLPLAQIGKYKVGMLICYDIFFPELAKNMALRGMDLLVCISASPNISREYFEAMFPARAIENTIFVAYANLLGTDRNMVFWGGGQVWDPFGKLLNRGAYFKEDTTISDISLDDVHVSRMNRPTLRNTKTDQFSMSGPLWSFPQQAEGEDTQE